MPTYLNSNSLTKLISGGGLCSDGKPDSTRFLNTLATKLLDMAKAIDARIEKIKQEYSNNTAQSGFYLAEITAPSMEVGVKYEYIEYITRYGPPSDGIFDEAKLKLLRQELGIVTAI